MRKSLNLIGQENEFKIKKNRSKSLILWKRQKCLKVAKLPVMYKNYQEIKKLGSGIFIFDQFAILTNLMP